MNNILISAGGRRVSLVKAFKDVLLKHEMKSKIFTTDLDISRSPAAYYSDDSFNIGSFDSINYISGLLEICIANKVSIVIPTLDTELKILSQNQKLFKQNDINVIVSSVDLINIFEDKNLSERFFRKNGIRTPAIYKSIDDFVFPVFIKPKHGSNSKDIYMANNIDEIKPRDLVSNDFIIMEYFDNKYYDEYTVDMYYDRNSKLISAVPRIRLKVVGGESNQGITKKNHVLSFVKERFNNLKGFIGCITLQIFSNQNQDIIAIEINPRFGGGYPFSLNAGANFPDYIVREYMLNENLNYEENWSDNCLNLRYNKEIFILSEKTN